MSFFIFTKLACWSKSGIWIFLLSATWHLAFLFSPRRILMNSNIPNNCLLLVSVCCSSSNANCMSLLAFRMTLGWCFKIRQNDVKNDTILRLVSYHRGGGDMVANTFHFFKYYKNPSRLADWLTLWSRSLAVPDFLREHYPS